MYIYKNGEELIEIGFLPKSKQIDGNLIMGFNNLSKEKLASYNYFLANINKPSLTPFQSLGQKHYIFDEGTQEYNITYDIIEMTEQEKEEFIDSKVKAIIHELDETNQKYVASRYPISRTVYFINIKLRAIDLACQEVLDDLNSFENWLGTIMNYYYMKEAELNNIGIDIKNGTKDLEDLELHRDTWDFQQFNATDPLILIATLEQKLHFHVNS